MSKRILIVEDEESIADLERDYLELSGFQVEVANDGETGLNKALKGEFDLIILDLMLPGVDGFEICREVRSQRRIRRSLWFLQRRMILTKSGDLDWERIII